MASSILFFVLSFLFFLLYRIKRQQVISKSELMKRTIEQIERGDIELAAELLSGIPDWLDKDPDVRYICGFIKYRRNLIQEALEDFLRSAKAGAGPALYSAGHILFHNEENLGSALKLLKRSAKRGPAVEASNFTLALIHYSMGNTMLAKRTLEKAGSSGKIKPALIANLRGLISMKEGNAVAASRYFTESIAADSCDVSIHLNLAEACRSAGRSSDELEALRSAERIDPDNKFVRLRLGEAFSLSNDLDSAMIHVNAALKLDPCFAKAYLTRALIHKKAGRNDEYVKDYERSVSFGPVLEALKS